MTLERTHSEVWLPCPKGQYAKATTGHPIRVWVGGAKPTLIKVITCAWANGRYTLEALLKGEDGVNTTLALKGIALDMPTLCASLLSQLSAASKRLPNVVVIERLLDFIIDQLTTSGYSSYRFSFGVGGIPWIDSKELGRLQKYTQGCSLKLSGEVFLHPAIFLQRTFQGARLPWGWDQRLGLVQTQRLLEPITLFLDISKPNKGIHYPSFNHPGVIVTGYRGGLERWAVEQAKAQARPYLQIRNYADVERLINFLPGARLVTPYQRSQTAYGKVRANLIEMVNVSQPKRRTA